MMHIDAGRCISMHVDARRCTSMQVDAYRCTSMHVDAGRCTSMHVDACQARSGCDQMRCIQMIYCTHGQMDDGEGDDETCGNHRYRHGDAGRQRYENDLESAL